MTMSLLNHGTYAILLVRDIIVIIIIIIIIIILLLL